MRIGVVGAGAWGTAFSMHLARKGIQVMLWAYEPELFQILKRTGENSSYLPGFSLPPQISFTDSLDDVAGFSDTIVLATPSFALRETARRISSALASRNILVLTKGLERETLKTMSDVTAEIAGNRAPIAALSGPSFAKEVAAGVFTSVVIASHDRELASSLQQMIHSDDFRVYATDDVAGVELGGAMKNVMAIGAGIIEGLNLGTNTIAAFVTRGLAEIKRLGKACGAKETTFLGLSGVGDLILTCFGALSRNRQFGLALSGGRKAADIIRSQAQVVEGYYTIHAVRLLSARLGIGMPISEELYRIVYEDKDLLKSINDIKRREFKEEDI